MHVLIVKCIDMLSGYRQGRPCLVLECRNTDVCSAAQGQSAAPGSGVEHRGTSDIWIEGAQKLIRMELDDSEERTGTATGTHFQTELRSVGYLVRFFSSSTRASWMQSLVDTLVKQSSSCRASWMSRDESCNERPINWADIMAEWFGEMSNCNFSENIVIVIYKKNKCASLALLVCSQKTTTFDYI